MRQVPGVLAALCLLGGCLAACSGPPSSKQFTVVLQASDGSYELPLALSDETGLVIGIEAAAPDPIADSPEPVARADPASPNAFIVSWLGGGCDKDASLTFKVSEGVYEVHVTVGGGFLGGCMAIGVPRDVRILTSKPLPIDSIVAAGQT